MDPWTCDLIVVRGGARTAAERRSLARDVERGLLLRLRLGVYVDRAGFLALTGFEQHIVRMRAYAAVAPAPPVFSHTSAAIVHGLPMLTERLDRVHVTVESAELRGLSGVAGHVFPLNVQEVERVGSLFVTTAARTVVDVAGATSFEEGVVIADGALFAGVPRAALEEAAEGARWRRSSDRIDRSVLFSHEGGHSAGESRSRVTMYHLGLAPLELQHEVRDRRGLAGILDFWDDRLRVGGEVDGRRKFLDRRLATDGAGVAAWNEKRREDRIALSVERIARWDYRESGSTVLLGPILAAVGLVPARQRPSLADRAAAAAAHVPPIGAPRFVSSFRGPGRTGARGRDAPDAVRSTT